MKFTAQRDVAQSIGVHALSSSSLLECTSRQVVTYVASVTDTPVSDLAN